MVSRSLDPQRERHRGYTITTREKSFEVSLVAVARAARACVRACRRGLNVRVSIEPAPPPLSSLRPPPRPLSLSPSLSCADVARSGFSTTELSTVGARKDFVSLLLLLLFPLLLLPASVSLLTFHCASRNSTSFMAGFYAARHENTLRRRAVNEKEIGFGLSFLPGRPSFYAWIFRAGALKCFCPVLSLLSSF